MTLASFLSGCMVGPNFHSPNPPQTKSYTEAPAPTKTISIPHAGKAGKAQHFNLCQDIPAKWWTLFHSPELNNLICMGLANSPTLAAAKAALRQAQENLNAQIGASLLPSINGQLTGERQRFSNDTFGGSSVSGGTSGPSLFNLFNASVNVSYTLDIFGGARREIEALCAQVHYEFFELEAAYLALTSNIVTTAITIASLRAQIEATQQLIQAQKNQLEIVNKQFSLGGVSKADVFSQEALLGQTRATLPPLQQNLVQNLHALSVLIGELPSENHLPKFDLNKLTLPTQLPISFPSRLVKQRPDIRASEALLHAASAQIGVATANLFPQFTLTGSYGWESNVFSRLIRPSNVVWNYGAQILQPIFQGGSLLAKRRAAIDAYKQALAQYSQVVLQGFQNVADSLRALEHDAKTFQAEMQAEEAARNALILTQKQFQLGGVSYLNLLNTQRQYQQANISRIQAQAARYTDTVALFQALGGGWWQCKTNS